MNTLRLLGEKWEETGDIAEILDIAASLPPPEDIETQLASLPEAEQARLRNILQTIYAALPAHIAQLEKEAADLREQMDQAKRATKACLVYNRAPRAPRNTD
jgi:hypothetical protein